jgi:hypothetical protein
VQRKRKFMDKIKRLHQQLARTSNNSFGLHDKSVKKMLVFKKLQDTQLELNGKLITRWEDIDTSDAENEISPSKSAEK